MSAYGLFAFTNEVFCMLKELSLRAIGRIHVKLKKVTEHKAYSKRNVPYLIVK